MMELPKGVDYAKEGITLPKEAVGASRLPGGRYEFFVWRVNPESSRVEAIKVIPVAMTGDMIRVASPDLQGGMVIAKNKARILREGIRVRPEDSE